jgi:hypothetical protein
LKGEKKLISKFTKECTTPKVSERERERERERETPEFTKTQTRVHTQGESFVDWQKGNNSICWVKREKGRRYAIVI